MGVVGDLEKRTKRNNRNKFLWQILPLFVVCSIGFTVTIVQSYRNNSVRCISDKETVVTKDNVHMLNESIVVEESTTVDELTSTPEFSTFVEYIYSEDCTSSVEYMQMMQELSYYNISSLDWTSYSYTSGNRIMYEINSEDTPIYLNVYFDGNRITGWEVL